MSRQPLPASLPETATHETGMHERLRASNRLLRALTEVQTEFIQGHGAQRLFARLLSVLLELTDSEYGFIGEVLRTPEGAPYVRAHAFTNIAWTDELRAAYEGPPPRNLELHNLGTLFGAVLTTGQPVVSNAPAEDPRSGGIPPGHPPLRTFLGLPFHSANELVGVVGIANRPGGYGEDVIEFLQPFLTTCSALLQSWRSAQQQRRAEEELRHQQEQLQMLALVAARTDNAVILTDAQGRIEWVNEGFTRLTGYTLAEVRGHTPGKLLQGPESNPDTVRHMRECVEKAERFIVELINYNRQGEPYWVRAEVQPLFDEQGRLTRFMAIESDVTQRKQMEQRLAASEERLRLALDSTEDGLWDWNLATGELFVTRQWLGMLGYREDELERTMATLHQRLCHPEDLPELEYRMRAYLEGAAPLFEAEARLRHKSGEWVWVLSRAKVVSRDVKGLPLRMVGTHVDITARKQAEEKLLQQEEELRRHRDLLEERVRQATGELEAKQAQLIQSEKMASLGQMAAGIAHEINNPMSYITSNLGTLSEYTQVLLRLLRHHHELADILGSGQRQDLEELLARIETLWQQENVDELVTDLPELLQESLEGARRIDEIVQSLKMFSRPDSGPPQRVDMNQILESTLKLVRNQLKYKCRVLCDWGELPLVPCHPTQLGQVFTNLLVNAAQSIETQGEIRITTRHESAQVVVSISDTGSGMTPETLAQLFTPFFTTKPPGKGTGLGLSISYSIINRHRGRIEVRSEPGQGSTFTVRLPVAVA